MIEKSVMKTHLIAGNSLRGQSAAKLLYNIEEGSTTIMQTRSLVEMVSISEEMVIQSEQLWKHNEVHKRTAQINDLGEHNCDSYFNSFYTKVKISSTVDTEPMILNLTGDQTYYPKFPKIRQKNIGTDTSNYFIDTLQISNLFLNGIGGDYEYINRRSP